MSAAANSFRPSATLPTSVKLAAGALLALPAIQALAERFVTLPIGPSRMLTIGLCAVALVPLVGAVLAHAAGARISGAASWATGVLVPLLAVAHLLAFARFADGPFGPVPGGPFRAAAVTAPGDWSDVAPLRYAELEVDPTSPRTLETVLLVYEGGLYVAANLPEGKRWPRAVRDRADVRVRLGGDEIYALKAHYVESAERTRVLRDAMHAKYGFDLSMGGPIWFFALERPTQG